MKKIFKSRYKGFTLVEIIVVLVILAILAAAMIPSLVKYIDKAKNQKYINQARDFVMAAQGGLIEAYALYPEGFNDGGKQSAIRPGVLEAAKGKNYGYLTSSYGMNSYKGTKVDVTKVSTDNGDRFKRAVCNFLGDYLENKHLKISDKRPEASKKASYYNNECAFVLAFNDKAKVIFVQFVNEGKMVTYDGNSYVVENDGAFLPFSTPPAK